MRGLLPRHWVILSGRGERGLFHGHPSQGRYEKMLANSATAAVCAGPDGIIISWNTAAEQLFGHSAQQAIGQPLSIIIPVEQRAAHEAGMARAVAHGHAPLTGRSTDIRALHADGSTMPVEISLSMWFEEGEPMFGALMRDSADRHDAKQRLEQLAHFDSLTSLHNRNALHNRLATEIETPCALLMLDLDGFKQVNDSLGHSIGDQLLAAVAARLIEFLTNGEFIARLGGDEFAILVPNCADPMIIHDLATNILASLHAPFELAGQSIFVGTSIGIAMSANAEFSREQLLSNADLALYSAKSEGGGVRSFFERGMQHESERKHRLGGQLRRAKVNNEFELWFQPQVSLADKSLSGVEALLRWHHPDHGILAPQAFIRVLEDCAIAEEVGDWIIEKSCAAVADWSRRGLGPVKVGINLFPAQLRSGRLVPVISSALARHGLCPDQLELEITENTVLRQNEQSTKALRKLKSMGVGIAFDDFGTGFASLSLLQKYPLTRLKIDRSFVAKVDRKVGDAAIVRAVIGMAKSLSLAVIAEGVETAEQEAMLVHLGCDAAQGYRYGRPMPAATLTELYCGHKSSRQLRAI